MTAEICRKMMKRQIENWEIECTDVLVDEILELYKELDEDGKMNYAKSFGRWYGDWLIGSGVFMMAQNVNTFTYQFDVIPIWFHSGTILKLVNQLSVGWQFRQKNSVPRKKTNPTDPRSDGDFPS